VLRFGVFENSRRPIQALDFVELRALSRLRDLILHGVGSQESTLHSSFSFYLLPRFLYPWAGPDVPQYRPIQESTLLGSARVFPTEQQLP